VLNQYVQALQPCLVAGLFAVAEIVRRRHVASPEPAKQALQRCERFIAAIITSVSSNKNIFE